MNEVEGRICPICNGTGGWKSEVQVVRCLNCSGKGITDTDSLYTSPLSGKVLARYGPGSVNF